MDASRLESLYTRLERPMFNVVFRWLWNRADAQEVVQDALVRVWRRREDVRLETVEALLYRTALNLASNRLRARRLRRRLSLEAVFERGEPTGEPTADPEERSREALVRSAVAAFAAIVLRTYLPTERRAPALDRSGPLEGPSSGVAAPTAILTDNPALVAAGILPAPTATATLRDPAVADTALMAVGVAEPDVTFYWWECPYGGESGDGGAAGNGDPLACVRPLADDRSPRSPSRSPARRPPPLRRRRRALPS